MLASLDSFMRPAKNKLLLERGSEYQITVKAFLSGDRGALECADKEEIATWLII